MRNQILTLLVFVSVRVYAHTDAPTPSVGDIIPSVQMEIPNSAWGFVGTAFVLLIWLYKANHAQMQDLIKTNISMSHSFVEQSTNNTKLLLENSYKAIEKMNDSIDTLSDAVKGISEAMQEMQRGFSDDRKQMQEVVSSLKKGIEHLNDRHDEIHSQLTKLNAKVDKLNV